MRVADLGAGRRRRCCRRLRRQRLAGAGSGFGVLHEFHGERVQLDARPQFHRLPSPLPLARPQPPEHDARQPDDQRRNQQRRSDYLPARRRTLEPWFRVKI